MRYYDRLPFQVRTRFRLCWPRSLHVSPTDSNTTRRTAQPRFHRPAIPCTCSACTAATSIQLLRSSPRPQPQPPIVHSSLVREQACAAPLPAGFPYSQSLAAALPLINTTVAPDLLRSEARADHGTCFRTLATEQDKSQLCCCSQGCARWIDGLVLCGARGECNAAKKQTPRVPEEFSPNTTARAGSEERFA